MKPILPEQPTVSIAFDNVPPRHYKVVYTSAGIRECCAVSATYQEAVSFAQGLAYGVYLITGRGVVEAFPHEEFA